LLAKEESERREAQYSDVRASDASAASCRQRRQPVAQGGFAARERKAARRVRISLRINGEQHETDVWEGESLLYALRERLGFPGSKNACEQGECGSCSVLLDGELVCSCLVLAAQAEGHDVVTVEGLAEDGRLHRVQEAFIATGAVQCGFCTPGLVVAAADLLAHNADPSDDAIREALSGNLCRCTGYAKIFDAVRLAASS
jgi:aerobic carbon-monoxide dehydrogenase small subunit